MKKFIYIFFLFCTVKYVSGQSEYDIKPIPVLNSIHDDIACGIVDGQLFYMTCGATDLVNDYQWNNHAAFHLESAIRGQSFAEWTPAGRVFQRLQKGDEGPATYNPGDSTLYFSSPENFDGAQGKSLKIYSMKFDGSTWKTPKLLSFCTESSDYTHPYFDADQQLLVFSSNRAGGFGKMDIWFTHFVDSIGWTEPVNPGIMVNSASNEIFPTIFNGDIFFSTDMTGGMGGFDIRKAFRNDQWKSCATLGSPINSNADDVHILFLSEEKMLVTSNRQGGMGGDDIYIVERKPLPEEIHKYKGILEFEGKPLAGVMMSAQNESNELVMAEKSDSTGHIDISKLLLNQSYRLQLAGIDPSLYDKTVLVLYDHLGNRFRELRFNLSGFADLELLPLNYADLHLLPLEDQSLLTLQIEGQLFENTPGDIGRNEPITILDLSGTPVAIAYTNDVGKFRFTDVEPQMEYTFKLSQATEAKNVLITDKGEKIMLPVLNAEINYTRVNPEEAIELVNEYNEKIVVSPKDLFVINRIYYEYNSAKLTAEATRQLGQLQIIMDRNQEIAIELRSHTDSRGNDQYNQKLSEKRASSAVQFLTSTGLAQSRFKASGLGESQLLNECDDGVSCTDPEHSINRRTEIRLSKIPKTQ